MHECCTLYLKKKIKTILTPGDNGVFGKQEKENPARGKHRMQYCSKFMISVMCVESRQQEGVPALYRAKVGN